MTDRAVQRGPPKLDGRAALFPDSPGGAVGRFANVHKSFKRPDQAPLVAIDTVSFDLHAGQLISLLGPSGCGKTTFLRIAAGLIPKTSGIVEINGCEVVRPQPDFGIVFQQPNLMPWRTVLKNVLSSKGLTRLNSQAACSNASPCAVRWFISRNCF